MGSTGPDQFKIPLSSGSSYNFSINWGDGISETFSGAANAFTNLTHTYQLAGEYNIQIEKNSPNGFPRIYFNNRGDKIKVLEIKNWGSITWQNFNSAFYGCSNLKITATDGATANTSTVTDFSNAWRNCSSLTSFPIINTSSCKNLSYTWSGCSSLVDFKQLDLSQAELFVSTWANCGNITSFASYNFNSLIDGTNCFSGSTIASSSYTYIITYLASNNNNINVPEFNGGLSVCGASAQSSYNYLIDSNWTIVDGTNGNFNNLTSATLSYNQYRINFYCDKKEMRVSVGDGALISRELYLTEGQYLKANLPFLNILDGAFNYPGELNNGVIFVKYGTDEIN